MRKPRGQVIIEAVFVLMIFAVLGMVTVSLLSGESTSSLKNLQGIQAMNIAEGGMRFTMAASLAADVDWSNNADFGPRSLNPGTFTVRYISKEKDACTIEVTGTVSGVNRKMQAGFARSRAFPSAFNYALYWKNSEASSSPLEIGSALIDPRTISGNVFVNGNASVYTTSQVISGEIYVPTGFNVTGGGIYSWEATSSPPPWPGLDNSYYVNLINRYDSHIPAAAPSFTKGSSTFTITLTGNNISYEAISINWLFGNLTVRGSGELIARTNFTVNGDLTVIPTSGETIALIAGNAMTIGSRLGDSTSLRKGTHLYTRSGEMLFNKVVPGYGSVQASGILMMTKKRVTLNWYGTSLGESSIIYIPPDATGIQRGLDAVPYVADISFSGTDIYYGSLICDCSNPNYWIRFYDGQMQGIIYAPISPVRLYGSNSAIRGAVVLDKIYSFYSPRMVDTNLTWSPNFLPSYIPPGFTIDAFSVIPGSWQEVY
ncbi:MAG: hypothetical protein PHH60_00375 [Candidatus Margulisbacteria bacterium]|nr:hypothetical protein [Candidatus Margulisiibacteriota bacterium]